MFYSTNFKISVCMASCNGSRFIQRQLISILEQSVDVEEIIIVDDASSDNTVEIILKFEDPRIRLVQNQSNLGVIQSFEKSILHATGDLICLCDQDDIWRRDKVEVVKRFFAAHPQVTVVLSDAIVIDRNEIKIRGSWFGPRGFQPGLVRNFLRNRYLGCTMTFRRSALDYCLPIPSRVPMHDMWIGMLNKIYGEVGYIAEPLVAYRRHAHNATTGKNAPLKQMILWRFYLALELSRRFCRRIIDRTIK